MITFGVREMYAAYPRRHPRPDSWYERAAQRLGRRWAKTLLTPLYYVHVEKQRRPEYRDTMFYVIIEYVDGPA